MEDKILQRKYLVIGGTGMLEHFCDKLPASELIIAARFISNKIKLLKLRTQIQREKLDYSIESSRNEFLRKLCFFKSLKICILWVHSSEHQFSLDIIENLSKRNSPPIIIHLFGSNQSEAAISSQKMSEFACKLGIEFYSIKLGTVSTSFGKRWLTNAEISTLTYDKIKQFI